MAHDGFGVFMVKTTRAWVNNNPTNLIYDSTRGYQGRARPPQDDDGYARYTNYAYGILAAVRSLHAIRSMEGARSIRELIGRFALKSPDVAGYIKYVSDLVGLEPDDRFVFGWNVEQSVDFVKAMVRWENRGMPYEHLGSVVEWAMKEVSS